MYKYFSLKSYLYLILLNILVFINMSTKPNLFAQYYNVSQKLSPKAQNIVSNSDSLLNTLQGNKSHLDYDIILKLSAQIQELENLVDNCKEANCSVFLTKLIQLLKVQMRLGEQTKGIYYQKAKVKLETLYEGYMTEGITLFLDGKYDKAMQKLENAVIVDARHLDPYIYLSVCAEKKNDYTYAFDLLHIAARIDGYSQVIYEKSSFYLIKVHRYKKALRLIQEGLEQYPQSIRLTMLGVLVSSKTDTPEEGKLLLEQWIKKFPSDEQAMITLGKLNEYTGVSEKAIKHYKIPKTNNHYILIEHHYNTGMLYFNIATDVISQIDSIRGKQQKKRKAELSSLKKKAKDNLEKATFHLEKSLILGADNLEIYSVLGQSYILLKKQKELKDLRDMLEDNK